MLNDKMEEACGIFAAYAQVERNDLMAYGYYGLCALQHRGQESAGVTIAQNNRLITHKGMGLVADVFTEQELHSHQGRAMIAHVRYSTTGNSSYMNAQPLCGFTELGEVAIAHNGNLVNLAEIKRQLSGALLFQTTTDTEMILNILAKWSSLGEEEAIKKTMQTIQGSFALTILIGNTLYGVRDPHGIRPLCLGKNREGMYFLASETCALDTIDAEFVRDIEPGEIIKINQEGVHSSFYQKGKEKASCAFEYIYFSRPDSCIDGIDTYRIRCDSGKYLYQQMPIDADVVIGVPDSGIAAAIGYAEVSGIPYGIGLVKNKYIGRTFISPTQVLREKAVKVKLNPIRAVVEGKKVIVIDDSLVRGTTSKKIIRMLRDAGVKEVHYRSASPIVKHECYFGIDISTKKELIGNNLAIDEIRQEIGADTLDFLKLENLKTVLGGNSFCFGCFTGNYPIAKEEIQC